MENYKEETAAKCLECGNEITYGRTDKKFCCRVCKDVYNNRIKSGINSHRIRVDSIIRANYNFLNNLVKTGIVWIPLSEAVAAGFRSGFVTSYAKIGAHFEYSCYDISFKISFTRIYDIRRQTLNQPPIPNAKAK